MSSIIAASRGWALVCITASSLLALSAGAAHAADPVVHPSAEQALDVAVQKIAMARPGATIAQTEQDALTVIVVEPVRVDSIGSIVSGVVEVIDDTDPGESRSHVFTFNGNDQTVAGTAASPTATVLNSPRLAPEQGNKVIAVSPIARADSAAQKRYPD